MACEVQSTAIIKTHVQEGQVIVSGSSRARLRQPWFHVLHAGVLDLSQLDAQLPLADIIILLAPLLPETRHMVNASFLSKVGAPNNDLQPN